MLDLTASDRCDRCYARAAHVAQKSGFSELLFCGHHHREFESALLMQGWRIISDESPSEPVPTAAYTD